MPPSRHSDWLSIRHDRETGIETIHAHFTGHAYDPHDHDAVLVGVTEQGVQQFRCRRRLNTSLPGRAILIEPGEVHDGHSPQDAGFTYAMLYLPQDWLVGRIEALRGAARAPGTPDFRSILRDDPSLSAAISAAFRALHGGEGRLARDLGLDRMVAGLVGHLATETGRSARAPLPAVRRARDALHAAMAEDIGLEELAAVAGIDRFRLNRLFRESFGLSPHGYLVQLRLKEARRRLALGGAPAEVAVATGFSDQSHLGRWFRRAYGMTPAFYRRSCTNVPDTQGAPPRE